MHGQLLALRKLVQLLDPPLHAFMAAKSSLNYFFCYRWLLIHFKREFAFDEVSVFCGFKHFHAGLSGHTVSITPSGQMYCACWSCGYVTVLVPLLVLLV